MDACKDFIALHNTRTSYEVSNQYFKLSANDLKTKFRIGMSISFECHFQTIWIIDLKLCRMAKYIFTERNRNVVLVLHISKFCFLIKDLDIVIIFLYDLLLIICTETITNKMGTTTMYYFLPIALVILSPLVLCFFTNSIFFADWFSNQFFSHFNQLFFPCNVLCRHVWLKSGRFYLNLWLNLGIQCLFLFP